MEKIVRFGFHLSIKGGVANAAMLAKSKGYRVFQLFVSNPRGWAVGTISRQQAKRFSTITKENDIIAFAHMPYLSNLASPRKVIRMKSVENGIENIRICNMLGIKGIVFHLGSHLGSGMDEGFKNIYDSLAEILDKTKRCSILLENTAGYRNSMGSRIEDIAKVVNEINSDRIGVCIDTCHLFASGYDLRSTDAVEKLEYEFESRIGSERLKLMHLNDSKYPLGSGLDRHWHIGRGYIGEEGFINIFRSTLFGRGPFVMETPYESEHSENMNLATALRLYREAREKPEAHRTIL